MSRPFPVGSTTRLAIVAFALIAAAGPAAAQGRPGNPVDLLIGQIEANADAIAALQAEPTLADLSCEAGDVPQYDGTQWVCGDVSVAAPVFYTVSYDLDLPSDPVLPVAIFPNVYCNFGDAVVSGGFRVPVGGEHMAVYSAPTETDAGRQGWRLGLQSPPSNFELSGSVYARCLDLTP